MNTTDIIGYDYYPIGFYNHTLREVYAGLSYNPLSQVKQRIGIVQIFDWYVLHPDIHNSTIPTLKEMKSMAWQYIASGITGLLFYSLNEFIWMNKYTPFEKRWKEFIELTDEIWKYKDVIFIYR